MWSRFSRSGVSPPSRSPGPYWRVSTSGSLTISLATSSNPTTPDHRIRCGQTLSRLGPRGGGGSCAGPERERAGCLSLRRHTSGRPTTSRGRGRPYASVAVTTRGVAVHLVQFGTGPHYDGPGVAGSAPGRSNDDGQRKQSRNAARRVRGGPALPPGACAVGPGG